VASGNSPANSSPEVLAQRLDVPDQAVAPVGGGVVGDRRPAGAAKVEDDQTAVPGQPAEIV
jgi:hypothetical protein